MAGLRRNSEETLARYQPFWTFVAIVHGVVCIAALGGAIARIVMDRRKKMPVQGDAGYKKPT